MYFTSNRKEKRILVDENMPYAVELFSRTGKVLTFSHQYLQHSQLHYTDSLIVRSMTKVNAKLLEGNDIKFVGTATAGTDHIDQAYLQKKGIFFSSAPGCNAIAVVEYIFSAILFLAERYNFAIANRTIGIVGVGNVGQLLNNRLKALGIRTLLCDPPRADQGDDVEDFHSLIDLVKRADILTFHVPLLIKGKYRTLHIVDEELLLALKPNTILINTCRGSVVNNLALLRVLNYRKDLNVVLDVWETEPELLLPLLNKVDIATAHIAGYSLEGKTRGTTQVFKAWTDFIGKPDYQVEPHTLLPPPKLFSFTFYGTLNQAKLKNLVDLVYDVRQDDRLLREIAGRQGSFNYLRKNYHERREWSSLLVQCNNADVAALLKQIGFNAIYLK